jgi:hypothetical protein
MVVRAGFSIAYNEPYSNLYTNASRLDPPDAIMTFVEPGLGIGTTLPYQFPFVPSPDFAGPTLPNGGIGPAASNDIFGSAESAIHLDDSCGAGNNNTVIQNTITEACAGVLLGTGTGNIVKTNNVYNGVNHTTLAGDTCTVPAAATSKNRQRPRPSPYMPMR